MKKSRVNVINRDNIAHHDIYSHDGWITRITTRNGVPIAVRSLTEPGWSGYGPRPNKEMPRGHRMIVSRYNAQLIESALAALAAQ